MNGEQKSPKFLENFLFIKIFETFRMAWQPAKLAIALGALAVIGACGWLMDRHQTVVATVGGRDRTTEVSIYVRNPEQLPTYIRQFGPRGEREGVFSTLWGFGAERFHGSLVALFGLDLPGVAANIADCFKAMQWAITYHYIYCLIFGIITLAVVALAGGAICRIAALECARGEKPRIAEAMRFSVRRFKSLVVAPLVPAILIAFAAVLILPAGLLGNVPWGVGELIVGLTMLLSLVAGALMAAAVIGTVVGFNLMFPAVAYDGTDSFDAVGRVFNYLCSRPWRTTLYTATAAVYGAVCYFFVRFAAFLLLWTTHLMLEILVWKDSASGVPDKIKAIWPEPSFMKLHTFPAGAMSWSESAASVLIFIFVLVVVGLLVAFVISFYFSASTVIYGLLRKLVDNAELSDVYAEKEKLPQRPVTEAAGPTEVKQEDQQAETSDTEQ